MDLSLSNITFNQILVFLAVAETKGFLKASAQIHLTQSAVSKSIAKLEKDLELQLFVRTTRQLQLTKDGEQLFEAWKPMAISMQTAYRHVLQNRDNVSLILRVGLVSTVIPEKYFSTLQECFYEKHPDIQLQIYIESMSKLVEMLLEEKLDIAFLPDFKHYSLDQAGLSWMWYQKRTARLIMSASHPLASCSSLQMMDILEEKFVSLQEEESDNYEKDLTDRFADYGVAPNIVLPYHSAYALRNLFRPQEEVCFVDQFFDNIDYEDTVKIPIEDEWNGIICSWKEPCNQIQQQFLELVRTKAVIED